MTFQRLSNQKYTYTCQFDFDIGYLVESPCRCCEQYQDLPKCAQTCSLLDRVRGILADAVLCSRRR